MRESARTRVGDAWVGYAPLAAKIGVRTFICNENLNKPKKSSANLGKPQKASAKAKKTFKKLQKRFKFFRGFRRFDEVCGGLPHMFATGVGGFEVWRCFRRFFEV